jgi:hypothetical protein
MAFLRFITLAAILIPSNVFATEKIIPEFLDMDGYLVVYKDEAIYNAFDANGKSVAEQTAFGSDIGGLMKQVTANNKPIIYEQNHDLYESESVTVKLPAYYAQQCHTKSYEDMTYERIRPQPNALVWGYSHSWYNEMTYKNTGGQWSSASDSDLNKQLDLIRSASKPDNRHAPAKNSGSMVVYKDCAVWTWNNGNGNDFLVFQGRGKDSAIAAVPDHRLVKKSDTSFLEPQSMTCDNKSGTEKMILQVLARRQYLVEHPGSAGPSGAAQGK